MGEYLPYILIGIGVLLILFVIVMYNKLVRLRNRFKNGFAQIDVQLKRRYDLIPNLVEVAKSYLTHEKETLQRLTEARSHAMAAESSAAANPGNKQSMANLLKAESSLAGAMQGFMIQVEAYPDLKANQTISQLMEELSSTENKISFARQHYNDSIMQFNTYRESFPPVIFAGMLGFSAGLLWEIENPVERENVRISMS